MKPFSDKELQRLVAELKSYAGEFGSPAEAELIVRAACAFEEVLSGTPMDEAFGRKRSRGRPKAGKPGKHFELAKRATEMRLDGQSWRAVCDHLDFPDQRELQRIVEREWPHVAADIARRVANSLN
ncbi:hypothetical protein [Bradyrhizobium yuanmingense]|uniref:hypothetical protein n=1 Tax=Bradyrhizobium yuanmingense TaxID=108015 RepID=UPI0023B8F5B1|nr:hypothetical protein [Bradyrhizobium yuanmingense]MDF0495385.1 hypothetical protein [Bradyrhizobium yuanmingense]